MKLIYRSVLYIAVIILFPIAIRAQELFVFTEPASNMPTGSIGLRASNWLMTDPSVKGLMYQFIPEVMIGVNSKWMIHADGVFSNQNDHFHAVGAGTFVKYRFYSNDDVNRHFRMAAFARASYNNSALIQQEIDISRFNSGYTAGMIATWLLHKQALSATVGFSHAYNNGSKNPIPEGQANEAINYALSTGRLILPGTYSSYHQTNLNLMVELLGQHLIGESKSFLDMAPSVQFIFNSQTRLDIGYKFQLYSNMQRVATNGFMIRIEHLLFNAL